MSHQQIERRASSSLSNDLLCQILEQQHADSKTLHEMKGDVTARVYKLESAASHNWWMTYVITPIIFLLREVAHHFGARTS